MRGEDSIRAIEADRGIARAVALLAAVAIFIVLERLAPSISLTASALLAFMAYGWAHMGLLDLLARMETGCVAKAGNSDSR